MMLESNSQSNSCLATLPLLQLHDSDFFLNARQSSSDPFELAIPSHSLAMAPLARTAASVARQWTRHTLPRPTAPSFAAIPKASSAITCQQTRGAAQDAHGGVGTGFDSPYQGKAGESTAYGESQFDSPYHRSGGTTRRTTDIPDFSKYKSNRDEITNRVFQYFMVGTFGALTAMGAKATVQGMFEIRSVVPSRRHMLTNII